MQGDAYETRHPVHHLPTIHFSSPCRYIYNNIITLHLCTQSKNWFGQCYVTKLRSGPAPPSPPNPLPLCQSRVEATERMKVRNIRLDRPSKGLRRLPIRVKPKRLAYECVLDGKGLKRAVKVAD